LSYPEKGKGLKTVNLVIEPAKIKYDDGGKRTMLFESGEFYNLIKNNPSALVTIVDSDGNEIRTFETKPIYEGLCLD
jgi:hypothetical protein